MQLYSSLLSGWNFSCTGQTRSHVSLKICGTQILEIQEVTCIQGKKKQKRQRKTVQCYPLMKSE